MSSPALEGSTIPSAMATTKKRTWAYSMNLTIEYTELCKSLRPPTFLKYKFGHLRPNLYFKNVEGLRLFLN